LTCLQRLGDERRQQLLYISAMQKPAKLSPQSSTTKTAMLTGLNHLTLAVRNLEPSVDFYRQVLGFELHARWDAGAYLSLGGLWLCLSLAPLKTAVPAHDYTHYAFSIAQEHFTAFLQRLRDRDVEQWQQNRSEGDSLYFLDPDGHKLEAHVGDLASRLAKCRAQPYAGMCFSD
jgi:glutathione S-transferase